MHILLVADGRSPITRRWIKGLIALQHRVTLVSTFPCAAIPEVQALHIIPVAFAGFSGSQAGKKSSAEPAKPAGGIRKSVSRFRTAFQSLRYRLGPLTVRLYARTFRKIAVDAQPDLIHALRIPFEGMLASFGPQEIPLIASIWGNDLTLHAAGSSGMRQLTERTLNRVDGLMADARRDIRLGRQWGFPADRPSLVVPGSGGIDLTEISMTGAENSSIPDVELPEGIPLVINPRGFRPGSVRNDVFFQAIPLVLERIPDVQFVCPAMAGQPEALRWVQRLKIEKYVRLLPYLPQTQVWQLFQKAAVSVSISSHDGTPNSLLEAMASGCFPIVGDIESLREWITPGSNGLLVEPGKPQGLAEALILALENPAMRKQAAQRNVRLIRERADINLVRSQIEVFYQRFLK